MYFKQLCIAALAALAITLSHAEEHAFSSAHISRHDHHHHLVHHDHGHHYEHVDYYSHPKYEFEYKVADHHTGDIKSHHEHRDGHKSESGYSWHDPHGTVKVIKYVSHH